MGIKIDTSGGFPELQVTWPQRKRPAETVDQWIARAPEQLNIVVETAAFAPHGVPESDSTQPCSMELRIRLAHESRCAEANDDAAQEIARAEAEIDARAMEITDSDFTGITAGLNGRLAEIETGTGNDIPELMKTLGRTDAELRAFRVVSGIQNQPVTRSFLLWSATAIGTTAGESLINGLLFKDVMGYIPGMGFAAIIGMSIATFGVGAGLGWAMLKRKEKNKRMRGGMLLAAMVIIAAVFLLGMAHYRTALEANEANAVMAARTAFESSPLRPFADFSLLPYLVLNVAGLALVAWKTVPMFGFLDLKRLQDAFALALRQVKQRLGRAHAECGAALDDALGACDAVVDRAMENARDSKMAAKSCEDQVRRARTDAEKLSKSLVACEQLFRETVVACHPAGRHIARFSIPPQGLPVPDLALDSRLAGFVTALDARSVELRAALPPLVEEIYALVNAAKARLQELIAEIEADARTNTGGFDNILRFRRKADK